MKLLIVGYGSIGKRHYSILSNSNIFEIQIVSSHEKTAKYQDLKTALIEFQPNYIIIASPTKRHYEQFLEIENNSLNASVLIEKPLFDKTYISEIPKLINNKYYVAYNLRFHPVIFLLKKKLEDKKVICAHIYAGSYLPNWRPNTDYKKCYSASKIEGGGVLRDLSHEIDYISYLFGAISKLISIVKNTNTLGIESEDICDVIFEMTSGSIISLHLDYLSKYTIRRGIVQLLDNTIEFDLVKGNYTDYHGLAESYNVDRNDTYILEHEKFLSDDRLELCTFSEGLTTVKIIDSIEESYKIKNWVNII